MVEETGEASLLAPAAKMISMWSDRQIILGTNWANVIDQRLEQASIILLLVSAGFLASNYCYGIEMKRALGCRRWSKHG